MQPFGQSSDSNLSPLVLGLVAVEGLPFFFNTYTHEIEKHQATPHGDELPPVRNLGGIPHINGAVFGCSRFR